MKKFIAAFAVLVILILGILFMFGTVITKNIETLDGYTAGSNFLNTAYDGEYANSIETVSLSEYDTYTDTDEFISSFTTTSDIKKVIPSELMLTVGEYSYIGYEYGFYVKTYHNKQITSLVYSDVFVFDITQKASTNADNTTTFTVSPLFQYQYRIKDQNIEFSRVIYKYFIANPEIRFEIIDETPIDATNESYSNDIDSLYITDVVLYHDNEITKNFQGSSYSGTIEPTDDGTNNVDDFQLDYCSTLAYLNNLGTNAEDPEIDYSFPSLSNDQLTTYGELVRDVEINQSSSCGENTEFKTIVYDTEDEFGIQVTTNFIKNTVRYNPTFKISLAFDIYELHNDFYVLSGYIGDLVLTDSVFGKYEYPIER